MRRLDAEKRGATAQEQEILARWGSWGALPQLFDESKDDWADLRNQLKGLLSESEYDAARRTTINAHYTDPAFIAPMWKMLQDIGFTSGRVLEPGSGAGTFIGLSPDGAEMMGIELDPISAAVSKYLYPDAEIRAESFAHTRLPDGYFDAVIGNVPFAQAVSLHDPRHNAAGHTMHNHFIIKSLALTRPGGVAAFLTSSFTMDSVDSAARKEMAQLGDLVGAVRLPTGAHRRAAGTDVVTDLLVFRRREDEVLTATPDWVNVRMETIDGHAIRINSYFGQNPSHVLGEMSVGTGMHGAQTLKVNASSNQDTGQLLSSTLTAIAAEAQKNGTVGRARRETDGPEVIGEVAQAGSDLWEGHISAQGDTFTVLQDGMHQPYRVFQKERTEMRALLGLRDRARKLLELEAASRQDSPEITQARADLATAYETYVSKYGPLNRVKNIPTSKVDEEGEIIYRREVPHAIRRLRIDPFAALVASLEVFDEESGTAKPAALLRRRVVSERTPSTGADSPADAIAISLDTVGRVDLPMVAELLNTGVQEARAQLGELVFDDPDTGGIEHRAAYLSGNIAIKLDQAREAAQSEPEKYERNIAALQDVLPTPLGPDEIMAKVGAPWVPDETYTEFLSEIAPRAGLKVIASRGGSWAVQGSGSRMEGQFSTSRRSTRDLFLAMLEQRKIEVTDTIDEKKVVNTIETAAANDKARAIQERFEEWLWEDPTRSAQMQRIYNRKFNSIALRDYTEAGKHLSLPGLAANFTPREHQLTAVARMINETSVGLFHEVGAGKTAEMVMGAMELKRLGLVQKPCIVVPNHMLEQFGREWMQLYPQARVLTAGREDLGKDGNGRLVARAAANDWDGIILTYGAFESIRVKPETKARYIESEMAMYKEAFEAIQEREDVRPSTIKNIERRMLRAEQVLEDRLNIEQKRGLSWEETGIDYLIVDEMHNFKNLTTLTAMENAPVQSVGSKRASDMHMKVSHLRLSHGERVMTAATATPIANSLSEAYIMTRYLRPELLDDAGLDVFDGWAATFADQVTELEIKPGDTNTFVMKTRFGKFQNVPELLRMWHTFADVKTADDLDLDTPDLVKREDGQRLPEIRLVPPSPELEEFVVALAERAENLSGKPQAGEDNMLKITGEGRRAALDMRMVGQLASTDTKIDLLSDEVAQIYKRTKDVEYLVDINDPDQGTHPRPGGLQIIWSDLGTPKEDRWNVYDEIRAQLELRGVPKSQVRFIHEAKNDEEKARMFEACRTGQISVIIGSTEKMGVGANIQNRAVAMHHLECPWRPADVQQREGRIIRQGNQNDEVEIYRWVTEKSFDAYMWQTVERKAKFINQVMTGKLDEREIEDVSGSQQLSFSEVKALATGNPLVMEKTAADAAVTKYAQMYRAWEQAQNNAKTNVQRYTIAKAKAVETLNRIEAAEKKSIPTVGDKFALKIQDRSITKRADATSELQLWGQWATSHWNNLQQFRDDRELLEIGGHVINARYEPAGYSSQLGRSMPPRFIFSIDGLPEVHTIVTMDSIKEGGPGALARIENLPSSGISSRRKNLSEELVRFEETLGQAQATLERPFRHTQAYSDAKAELARVNAAMEEQFAPDAETEQQGSEQTKHTKLESRVAAAFTALAYTPPEMEPTTFGPRMGI